MIKPRDQFSLLGPAGNDRIERRPQDQLRLLEGVLLTKVPQKLQESDGTWQIALADAAKHAQVGLQQGEQALGPIFMDVTPRVFLLSVIDEVIA